MESLLKDIGKYIFMVELAFKYMKIFKKTFFHPFITMRHGYKELSKNRQEYSNEVLEFLNIEVEMIGEVPSQNKILYTINHRSLLDIIVMENIFSKHGKNGAWIAKQVLFDAFYGDFFKLSGSIAVDQDSKGSLLKFYKSMKKILNKVDDMNLYIFPEGERYAGDGIKSFQNGAEKIANANNLKIVPVFIDDTLESVFKNSPYKEKRKVKVYVGDIVEDNHLEFNYKVLMNIVEKGKN